MDSADTEARLAVHVVDRVIAREAVLEFARILAEHRVLLRAGLPLMTQLELTRTLNRALLALGVRGLGGAAAVQMHNDGPEAA